MTYTINWNAINNAVSLAILKSDRLESLLEDLGCHLKTRNGRDYRGPCPVHGGDSDSLCLEIGEAGLTPYPLELLLQPVP